MKSKNMDKITELAVGKNVFKLFVIYFIMQALMIIVIGPLLGFYTPEISPEAQLGYDSQNIFQYIENLTIHGRNLYTAVGLFDIVFAIVYSAFYTLLLCYLFKKVSWQNPFLSKLQFLPLFAGIADLIENTGMHLMIKLYPSELSNAAIIVNIFTNLKWVGTMITMLLLLAAVVILIIKNILRLKKGEINE